MDGKSKSKSIFVRDVEYNGIKGSLQILNPKTYNGRLRVYTGLKLDILENRQKPKFTYYKVSKDFIKSILDNLNKDQIPDQTNDQNMTTKVNELEFKSCTNNNYATALEKFS